jgi:hypothetical protein
MDQQFIDRERELFKLNAKLNAKSKKIDPSIIAVAAAATTTTTTTTTTTKIKGKTVQIHTTNSNFNYYEEQLADEQQQQQQQQQKSFELMCKKMNITNQPVKKPQEIVYPLFNRQTLKQLQQQHSRRVDIHMPTASLMSDGYAEEANDSKSIKTETTTTAVASFKNESMVTHCSDESSAIPAAEPVHNMPLPPPPCSTDIIPKCIEKKISNDGLMK